MKNVFLFWAKLGCLLAAIFCLSCVSLKSGYFKDDEKNATQAVQEFHDLLNQENYEQIYTLTDQRAKATKSKDELINMLKAVRLNLGKVIKSEPLDSKVAIRDSYREVTLRYKTKFENAERTEQFVWYVNEGKAGLFSYSQPELNP